MAALAAAAPASSRRRATASGLAPSPAATEDTEGAAAAGVASATAYTRAGVLPRARLVRPVTWAGVSPAGIVAAHCACDGSLHAYALGSGAPLCPPARLPFPALAFAWSGDGHLLLVGGAGPHVLVLCAHTLAVQHRVGVTGGYLHREAARLDPADTAGVAEAARRARHPPAPLPEPVTSLCLTEHEQALVVGFADGSLRIFTAEEAPVTAKMLSRFEEKVGF